MKKSINKLVGSVFALALLFTSCNSDDAFTYSTPEQAAVTQLTINSTASPSSQCRADITITSTDQASVYYLILPSVFDAPTSSDVFSSGTLIELSSASSATVTSDNFAASTAYTVYAVSVNKDGLRSEQVFTNAYSQPAFTINTDTTYSSSVMALGSGFASHTATFTPTATANQFLIDSSWGPNFVADVFGNPAYQNNFLYSGTLTINSDFTVTIVGNDAWATGGSGVYDPCTNQIAYTLNHTLFTAGGQPVPVDVVLSPDNL